MSKLGDKLKNSVASAAAVAAAVPANQPEVHDRFARADALMSEHPDGLAGRSAGSRPQGAKPPGADVPQSENVEVMVDIHLLDDNPYNARQIYDEKIIQERATSLASERGQMETVKIATHPEKPGHFVLIDGHYRKRGALRIGWTQLRCTVRKVATMLELYKLSYALNREHAPQTALDDALAWRKLMDDGLATDQEDLADITKMSPPNVSKTLALLDLPPPVLDRLTENPDKISVAIGYELSLYCKDRGEEATLNLAARVVAEDLSKRDIAALRSRAATPAKRDRSRQYKIRGNDGTQIGLLKDFDDGRIELKTRIVDPKERAALVEELKRRLGQPSAGAAAS